MSDVRFVNFRDLKKRETDHGRTDGWTDGRTDGQMDRPSYRDAWTHLKIHPDGNMIVSVAALGGHSVFIANPIGQYQLGAESLDIYGQSKIPAQKSRLKFKDSIHSMEERAVSTLQPSMWQIIIILQQTTAL